ncbi:MAG: enoyl-CoA hydratase-related protein [Actinomycetota bacterium]
MAPDIFEVEIADGVARCTMNGSKMNALGEELLYPLVDGLKRVLHDDKVRVIVLRGGEGNFCSGGDVGTMGEEMDPTYLNENMRLANEVGFELHEGPKPVITEVDGWAVGGGMGLAMSSDLTYATERARFMMSFVRISIIPDLGSSYLLPLRVGLLKAKELVFTGRVVEADEALTLGIVNRVVPHEEIADEVMTVARKLATRSPRMLAVAKRNMNMAHRTDLRTILDLEESIQPLMVLAPEHHRDIQKFMEKKSEK